jgi:hypothetical protein
MVKNLRHIIDIFFDGRPLDKKDFLSRHELPENW